METPDNVTSADEVRSPSREKYIPLTKTELVRFIIEYVELPSEQASGIHKFAQILDSLIHHEFHERLECLRSVYSPFDADHEPTPAAIDRVIDSAENAGEVFDRLTDLLHQANYKRLDQAAIKSAMREASDWGMHLNVDLDAFERLEVFVRGDVVDHRQRRHWRNLYRSETIAVRVYKRLVVAVRMRADEREPDARRPIFLKMFKNIPQADIDMLLPGTRFRITWLDQGKIILPTVSGLAMAISKIAMKSFVVFTLAGMKGTLALLGLVGGTIGYGVKSFFGYLRTKDKYQLNLTQSLYYQNLDNDAGVIFRILDEAETQEFCEAVLAYVLLSRDESPTGLTAAQLDTAAEQFLRRALDVELDFDLAGALEKLSRLGMVEDCGDGTLQAKPIGQVLEDLDARWDGLFVVSPRDGSI